jgi:formyl-CoA transferase
VGVTFGIVGTIDEALTDEQMQACGALVPFADGKGLTVSTPFHIEGVDKRAPDRAPGMGEHTDDVLGENGYSVADIARLRAEGVVS